MKTRLIYSKMCVSRQLADLTDASERLYFRLLSQCDDAGRFYADAGVVCGVCWPTTGHTAEETAVCLDDLELAGLIRRYRVAGVEYLELPTFRDHQKFRGDRPRTIQYPDPPDDNQMETSCKPTTPGCKPTTPKEKPTTATPDSCLLTPDSSLQESVSTGEPSLSQDKAPAWGTDADVDTLFTLYRDQVRGGQDDSIFSAGPILRDLLAKMRASPEQLTRAIENYRTACERLGQDPPYRKKFANFLRGGFYRQYSAHDWVPPPSRVERQQAAIAEFVSDGKERRQRGEGPCSIQTILLGS